MEADFEGADEDWDEDEDEDEATQYMIEQSLLQYNKQCDSKYVSQTALSRIPHDKLVACWWEKTTHKILLMSL